MYNYFEHAQRDLNRTIHLLAKFSFDGEGNFVWANNFPSWLFKKVYGV